ncbi:MAG: hypothetical protein AB4352_01400 [Hormoscilla sp.]
MKKPIWMTILAFGTLLVGSCTAQTAQTPQNQTSSLQSEVTTPGPTKKSLPITTAAINDDLRKLLGGNGIPSIDPEERTKKVKAGGRDPFALVLVQPEIIFPDPLPPIPPPPPPPPPIVDQPGLIDDPSQIGGMVVDGDDLPRPIPPALPPIETVRLPILTTQSLTTTTGPIAPVPPAPEIASAVKVSGVIELGSGKKAIVQVPGEKTQRYVAEGEWLGQGQVQVKRIELAERGSPTVILSENGREVVKMVGSSNTIAGSFGWTN